MAINAFKFSTIEGKLIIKRYFHTYSSHILNFSSKKTSKKQAILRKSLKNRPKNRNTEQNPNNRLKQENRPCPRPASAKMAYFQHIDMTLLPIWITQIICIFLVTLLLYNSTTFIDTVNDRIDAPAFIVKSEKSKNLCNVILCFWPIIFQKNPAFIRDRRLFATRRLINHLQYTTNTARECISTLFKQFCVPI